MVGSVVVMLGFYHTFLPVSRADESPQDEANVPEAEPGPQYREYSGTPSHFCGLVLDRGFHVAREARVW